MSQLQTSAPPRPLAPRPRAALPPAAAASCPTASCPKRRWSTTWRATTRGRGSRRRTRWAGDGQKQTHEHGKEQGKSDASGVHPSCSSWCAHANPAYCNQPATCWVLATAWRVCSCPQRPPHRSSWSAGARRRRPRSGLSAARGAVGRWLRLCAAAQVTRWQGCGKVAQLRCLQTAGT